MSIYRELAYDRVVSRIKGIQFCVMSDAEIRRRSVCEVTENSAFSGNEPTPNGLFDLRMGVIDNNKTCATCGQRTNFCPSHFGHIVMARPVFFIQFFEIVRKLLRCVCFRCSKCLVSPDSPEVRAVLSRKISNQKRWEAMNKLCQNVKRCGADTVDGCGAKVPAKVFKTDDGTLRIKMQWRDVDDGGAGAAGANDDEGAGPSTPATVGGAGTGVPGTCVVLRFAQQSVGQRKHRAKITALQHFIQLGNGIDLSHMGA